MPAASYTMEFDIRVASALFGATTLRDKVEFFPKNIVGWLVSVELLLTEHGPNGLGEVLEAHFKRAFKAALLAAPDNRIGYPECFYAEGSVNGDTLDKTATTAWRYFMDGTYGVCLRHQTPLNVVRKHIAAVTLEKVQDDIYNAQPIDRLKALRAVEEYGELSTKFAPHDRHLSSRQRLYRPVACHLNIAVA